MTIRAQVTLPADSALPADAVVNTFHFSTVDKLDATFTSIGNALQAFYSGCKDSLSTFILHTGIKVKYYDLEQPTPRPPIYEQTLSITAPPVAAALPPEVAICVSFQGDKVAGTPQARRRGRIFLGPLATTANSQGLVASTEVTKIVAAAKGLIDASTASTAWQWMVMSRATNPPVGDPVVITNGWVDNAFDVQRRRGLSATTRTTFVA